MLKVEYGKIRTEANIRNECKPQELNSCELGLTAVLKVQNNSDIIISDI